MCCFVVVVAAAAVVAVVVFYVCKNVDFSAKHTTSTKQILH